MSEAASGGTGSVATSPNTAGDVGASNMPSVPASAGRKSLSDFARARKGGDLPAQAPANQQTPQQRSHFQRTTPTSSSDNRQQAHPEGLAENENARQLAQPTNPKTIGEGAEEPTPQGEPKASDAQLEAGAEQGEQEAAPGSLSDAEIVQRYREWEKSDLAPEEIFADKLHAVKVRGQERYVDYNELRQGYMRHGDYTARGNELKQREQQVEQHRKSIDEHFATIKDPDQFLEIYERNGYSDVLEQVAEKMHARRTEHRSLVVAAGRAMAERMGYSADDIRRGAADNDRNVVAAMQAADQRLKQARSVEIENRKLEFERKRFEAERQAAQRQQEAQKDRQLFDNQISQLRPGAFKAHGIPDNQGNRVAFLRHLQSVVNLEGLQPEGFTRAQMMSAARNMREELEDQRQAESSRPGAGFMSDAEYRAKQQADARRAALGPNRVATGAGKPIQSQERTGRSASDFARQKRAGLLGK